MNPLNTTISPKKVPNAENEVPVVGSMDDFNQVHQKLYNKFIKLSEKPDIEKLLTNKEKGIFQFPDIKHVGVGFEAFNYFISLGNLGVGFLFPMPLFLSDISVAHITVFGELNTAMGILDQSSVSGNVVISIFIAKMLELLYSTPTIANDAQDNPSLDDLVIEFTKAHEMLATMDGSGVFSGHDIFQLNDVFNETNKSFIVSGRQAWQYFIVFNLKGLKGVVVCSDKKVYVIFRNINEWVMKLVLPKMYVNPQIVTPIETAEEMKDFIDRLICYHNTALPIK